MKFFEKNNSPGLMINLDHVASISWDNGLRTEFLMANGQIVIWEYENEDFQMEDLDLLANVLHESGHYLSVDKDEE